MFVLFYFLCPVVSHALFFVPPGQVVLTTFTLFNVGGLRTEARSSAPVTQYEQDWMSASSTNPKTQMKDRSKCFMGHCDSLIDRGETQGVFGHSLAAEFSLRFGCCGGSHGNRSMRTHTHTHTECLAAIMFLSTGTMTDNHVSFPLLPSVPYSVCSWGESSLFLLSVCEIQRIRQGKIQLFIVSK